MPIWFLALEIADGDPLRAQQMIDGLTEESWAYYQAWVKTRNEVGARKHKGKG